MADLTDPVRPSAADEIAAIRERRSPFGPTGYGSGPLYAVMVMLGIGMTAAVWGFVVLLAEGSLG